MTKSWEPDDAYRKAVAELEKAVAANTGDDSWLEHCPEADELPDDPDDHHAVVIRKNAAPERTTAMPEKDRPTISLDEDLLNADWTKQTWDLEGITSAEALRAYLDARGETVAQFKKRPIYKLNVKKLRWLREL